MGDDEWPQQQAQRDVMLADFDFHNGFGDRSVQIGAQLLPLKFRHCVSAVLTSHDRICSIHSRTSGIAFYYSILLLLSSCIDGTVAQPC